MLVIAERMSLAIIIGERMDDEIGIGLGRTISIKAFRFLCIEIIQNLIPRSPGHNGLVQLKCVSSLSTFSGSEKSSSDFQFT